MLSIKKAISDTGVKDSETAHPSSVDIALPPSSCFMLVSGTIHRKQPSRVPDGWSNVMLRIHSRLPRCPSKEEREYSCQPTTEFSVAIYVISLKLADPISEE